MINGYFCFANNFMLITHGVLQIHHYEIYSLVIISAK